MENCQWFEEPLDQALKPSSYNSARQHMCSWSLSRSWALRDLVQSSALAGCRDHPPKWQRASFHLVFCTHERPSTAVPADARFLRSPVLLQLDTWTTLSCTRGASEAPNQRAGAGRCWKLLNCCLSVLMWRKWEQGSLTPWKWLEMRSTKEALMSISPLSYVVPSFPAPAADMQSQGLGF